MASLGLEHDPERPAPHVMRGVKRFSETHALGPDPGWRQSEKLVGKQSRARQSEMQLFPDLLFSARRIRIAADARSALS